jgi:hypothetical protein
MNNFGGLVVTCLLITVVFCVYSSYYFYMGAIKS